MGRMAKKVSTQVSTNIWIGFVKMLTGRLTLQAFAAELAEELVEEETQLMDNGQTGVHTVHVVKHVDLELKLDPEAVLTHHLVMEAAAATDLSPNRHLAI